MIPFDFIYCRPNSLEEAREAFFSLEVEGKTPVYYAGGSEIITMSRTASIRPGAVIDIKKIPECMLLSKDNAGLHIGSVCTLNQVKESNLFPLLTLACGRIADHTNQCRITLGGNLCGTIIYRETSLPLMLADATITVFGSQGLYTAEFQSVFNGRMQLEQGAFIVQVHIPSWALQAPHYHVKRTTNEKIDYPLVSMASLLKDGRLRTAFSGICSYPFRSAQIESVLNDYSLSYAERAEKALALLPEPVHSDAEGSGKYRLFVFKNIMEALLEEVQNAAI